MKKKRQEKEIGRVEIFYKCGVDGQTRDCTLESWLSGEENLGDKTAGKRQG